MTDQPPATPAADASVHRARPAEAEAVATLTLGAWRAESPELLPHEVLDRVGVADLAADWQEAIASPPSPRHLVLTALEGDDVVGYVLAAPSQDPDAAADGTSAEVLDLVVRADRTRRGHGSRLLAAAVDTLRGAGCTEVVVWVPVGDDARLAFLASAGLVPDGSSRTLDGGPGSAALRQVRLSARID